MRIGFLLNPIAGMGGAVGLKGTDSQEILEEAIRRGALKISAKRAIKTLKPLSNEDIEWFTCKGEMGEDVLKASGIYNFKVSYEPDKKTSAKDTKKACESFIREDVNLVLFCGGDGTARDVLSVVLKKVPILGIPSGVKMFSAVFGINPEITARIVSDFLNDRTEIREEEILDISEEDYRKGRLEVKLYGYALVPTEETLTQTSKSEFASSSEEEAKREIAEFALEFMRDSSLYILGAGTTVKTISEVLKVEKSLLGVDVVKNGELLAKDVSEKELLEILEKEKRAKIIVSPIGAQGFVFGRGNQQISSKVIKKIGVENVIIVATPHKLQNTRTLYVDTGDEELDRELSGYKQVISGYRRAQMRRVLGGSKLS
ncbi:MAG: ATP-NAD kinase family protein [Candidatus Methanofastidiosia archaeon]